MLKFRKFLVTFLEYYINMPEDNTVYLCVAIKDFKTDYRIVSWYYSKEIKVLQMIINGALSAQHRNTLFTTDDEPFHWEISNRLKRKNNRVMWLSKLIRQTY